MATSCATTQLNPQKKSQMAASEGIVTESDSDWLYCNQLFTLKTSSMETIWRKTYSWVKNVWTEHHLICGPNRVFDCLLTIRWVLLTLLLIVWLVPGVTEFLANSSPPLFDSNNTSSEWLTDLDQDDINMLHGFGSLTASALLEKVKELQNLSYQLGLEEAREMTRGKFLNVLQSRPKRHKR